MGTFLIHVVLHHHRFKQCLLVLQAVPVTWEWYHPWQLPPPHILFLRTVLCDIVTWEWYQPWQLHSIFCCSSWCTAHQFQEATTVSLYEVFMKMIYDFKQCQFIVNSLIYYPELCHIWLWLFINCNQSRFWNQGTLAAWFLQLLTLAMYTSRLLVGGAPAHHHHWVNWKHSTLHSLMRQFVGWEGSKTRLCQHMNTFSSFALWTFPALLVSDIISWSFYHRYTTSRIVHIW